MFFLLLLLCSLFFSFSSFSRSFLSFYFPYLTYCPLTSPFPLPSLSLVSVISLCLALFFSSFSTFPFLFFSPLKITRIRWINCCERTLVHGSLLIVLEGKPLWKRSHVDPCFSIKAWVSFYWGHCEETSVCQHLNSCYAMKIFGPGVAVFFMCLSETFPEDDICHLTYDTRSVQIVIHSRKLHQLSD